MCVPHQKNKKNLFFSCDYVPLGERAAYQRPGGRGTQEPFRERGGSSFGLLLTFTQSSNRPVQPLYVTLAAAHPSTLTLRQQGVQRPEINPRSPTQQFLAAVPGARTRQRSRGFSIFQQQGALFNRWRALLCCCPAGYLIKEQTVSFSFRGNGGGWKSKGMRPPRSSLKRRGCFLP